MLFIHSCKYHYQCNNICKMDAKHIQIKLSF